MNTYLILGIIALVLVIVFAIVFSKKPTLAESIKKLFNKEKIAPPVKIIEGSVNFMEVVNYFKSLKLDKEKHIPFVAKAEAFKEILKFEPKKQVALFIGVFDEEATEIIHSQIIEADELDAKTREVLGNEDLVVLS
jgi:hypothetical protein